MQYRKSVFPFASALASLAAFGAATATLAPAVAQEKEEVVIVTPNKDRAIVTQFLNRQLTPIVPQDFEGALRTVEEFLQANPNLAREQRLRVIADSSWLLYSKTPRAKRKEIANFVLSFLNDNLRQIDETDLSYRQEALKYFSYRRVQILEEEKRSAEAATALREVWPLVESSPGNVALWAQEYRIVHNQQGQPQQAVAGLISLFEQRLPRQPEFPQDVAQHIVSELIVQKRYDEARSWAKLIFLMSSFEKPIIENATWNVNRTLAAGGTSLAPANLFALAQTDPKAPNPLDDIKLPQYDTSLIRKNLADPKVLGPLRRLNALLAVEDYHGAMLFAQGRLAENVTEADRALDVARVFKAKDGSIARANQFLAYYQKGQGTDPIPAFLQETQ